MSVEGYVSGEILSDRENGLAESANARGARAAEALGRLCDILARKGLLDMEDLTEIAGAYHRTDAKPPKLQP